MCGLLTDVDPSSVPSIYQDLFYSCDLCYGGVRDSYPELRVPYQGPIRRSCSGPLNNLTSQSWVGSGGLSLTCKIVVGVH